ncbi:hypothetical protein KSP39_PZI003947 [Platanthera zijinensis]|uniref:Myb/SANT-like domain-containing protein n=1 Tax=Platanthera zijinensis TaxID=2320716 RepID=A0AAP0FVQ0_9ASPA
MWDNSDVFLFCDICIKEIERGNRPTTHFSKEGWANIAKKFEESTGKKYDKVQFKNKWDHLKKEWKLWTELKRGETGLGWNTSRKTIDASDEWWDERLKVVPAAKKFRYSGIQPELEEKLNMMFSSVVATGHHACTPHSRNVGPESTGDRALSDGGQEDVDVSGVPPVPENTATSEVGHRRRKGQKKDITAVLEDMAESSRTMCRFMQEPPKSNSSFPIAQALEKLGTYHEVQSDKAFHFFAITYLMDKNHRETFMCLPEGLNVEWLRSRYTSGV